MSDLAIGDSVSFMWGGIPRTGKVIGSCPKKVFIEFNYRPGQVKKKWIGRSVVMPSPIPMMQSEERTTT